jgi:Na+/H+ antiporter NhaA
VATQAQALTGRTAWARNLALPVRDYLRTESGGAVVLLAGALAALVWANVGSSYETVWTKELSIQVGGASVSDTLRGWINDGLMVFFFLVAGLEARREMDMGELQQRRRIALPLVAAAGGMIVPISIFLAFNAGHSSAQGWGAAMATDTAFALGILGLVAKGYPRLRTFILTLAVFDDLIALVVITTAYSETVSFRALGLAVVFFAALLLVLRRFGARALPLAIGLGCATWVALYESGIHPTVAGLALGLSLSAYPPMRTDLEETTAVAREFREQPTAELAREAQRRITASISPNERVQDRLHPWTSYLIVPLFALANAGTPISGDVLRAAFTSPITLGIVVGYVVGKPVGILAASWLATRRKFGLRLPVGWPNLFGGAAIAGIGFTVSLLVATLAFDGTQLTEAKLGILGAAIAAAAIGSTYFTIIKRLPTDIRARLALGRGYEEIVDLAIPVDPETDHIRGPQDAPVTLVEYGDFECPFCGRAEPILRDLVAEFGDELRFVFRDLPLTDVHPRAQLAAEASEAAAAQGKYWEMHDLLFEHQDALAPRDLVRYAEELGLDVDRFRDELRRRVYAPGIAEDVESADESDVAGTPTFFINGRRHQGAYDEESLAAAVRRAWLRARVVG